MRLFILVITMLFSSQAFAGPLLGAICDQEGWETEACIDVVEDEFELEYRPHRNADIDRIGVTETQVVEALAAAGGGGQGTGN